MSPVGCRTLSADISSNKVVMWRIAPIPLTSHAKRFRLCRTRFVVAVICVSILWSWSFQITDHYEKRKIGGRLGASITGPHICGENNANNSVYSLPYSSITSRRGHSPAIVVRLMWRSTITSFNIIQTTAIKISI